MGAVLQRIDDPRDNLGKATRDELWDFAKAIGALPAMVQFLETHEWNITRGWVDRTTAPDRFGKRASQLTITKAEMENWLRQHGNTQISVAVRAAGYPTGQMIPPAGHIGPSPAMAAAPQPTVPPPSKSVAEMTMNEMRALARERGIKMARTDNANTLRAKLA